MLQTPTPHYFFDAFPLRSSPFEEADGCPD
jgi:hypothetical protein